MSTTNSQILERQPGKGIQLQLALDDAFADNDDQPFEFSPTAVRRHFAEQERWAVVDQATETSSVNEPDTSISTLYLDGSTCASDSASVASQSHTPVDQDSPHDRSSVALEESDDYHHFENGEEPAHPTVHIDVSKRPSGRVSVIEHAENGAAASDETQYPKVPSLKPSALDLPTMTTSSSLPNALVSVPPPQSHRPSRSTGPTIFQKVVSKTRPHFLPPKSREEDLKHLADWEAMMKQSRAAGKPIHLATISLH